MQGNHETNKNVGCNFLYHIFKADKEQNIMPLGRAKALLELLIGVFTDSGKN